MNFKDVALDKPIYNKFILTNFKIKNNQ